MLVQCDCCDYFSIPRGEDYEICPVCFWEQDAFGIAEPEMESNANHGLTLIQGRSNFLEFGACDKRALSNILAVKNRGNYRHEKRMIER